MVATIGNVSKVAEESAKLCMDLIPFSGTVGAVLRTFHVAHFCFANYEDYRAMTQQTTAFGLGALVHITAGNVSWVREGARLIYAGKAFLRCLDLQKKIAKSCTTISDIWNDTYPLPMKYLTAKGASDTQDKEIQPHLISNLYFLPNFILGPLLKAEALGRATTILSQELFLLSCAVNDLYKVLTFESETQQRAVIQSIVNAGEIIERLTEPQEVVTSLMQNEVMFNKLLSLIGSKYKTQDICNKILPQTTVSTSYIPKPETVTTTGSEMLNMVRYIFTGTSPKKQPR